MSGITSIVQWLAGDGLYHNLIHCMGNDTLWIVTTVVLDLAVAAGYLVIAMHWWKNQRLLPDVPAKRALAHMRNIFLFCGICGYIFIPIKMFWPAWRLYDGFMVALVYFTWRYAWNAGQLRVVYRELGRSTQLEKDLAQSREDSKRRAWFLNAVSHDLRTPLNAIALYTTLAQVKLEENDAEGQRDAVEAIRANTGMVVRMLDHLLDYASLEFVPRPPQVTTFDLATLESSVVDRAALLAQASGLSIRCRLPKRVVVRTDREILERILDNLLSNAVKYTKTGGVRIEADIAGSDLEIHVIDTGCGIPVELQGRIFEEFYQIDNVERNAAKGHGLGLAIARRLVQMLGGQIVVESAIGNGSRFSVLLPDVIQDSQSAVAA